MACCQYQCFRIDLTGNPIIIGCFSDTSINYFVADSKPCEPCIEMDCPAAFEDCFAHGLYDLRKLVCSDMRMCIYHYFRIGAVCHQEPEYRIHISSLGGTGVELTI